MTITVHFQRINESDLDGNEGEKKIEISEEERTPIGRNSLPGTDSKQLSRKQLELGIDANGNLFVQRLGVNPSFLIRKDELDEEKDKESEDRKWKTLQKNKKYPLFEGDVLSLLTQIFPFKLIKVENVEGKDSKKKKIQSDLSSFVKDKKRINETEEKVEGKNSKKAKKEEGKEGKEKKKEEKNAAVDSNEKIIEILNGMGDNEKANGRDIKSRAYYKAVRSIKNSGMIIKSGAEAMKLDGIGKKIGKKIDEVLATGGLKRLDKDNSDPRTVGLRELSRVYGIGHKVAVQLYDTHSITSIEQLKKHRDLLSPSQLIGLDLLEDIEKRIPRSEMELLHEFVEKKVKETDPKLLLTVCGSYRRGGASSGDIDCLITRKDWSSGKLEAVEKLIAKLKNCGFITHELANGEKKFMGVCRLPSDWLKKLKKGDSDDSEDEEESPYRRIDLRFIPFDNYACAIAYFTGSDKFNVELRLKAMELQMTLNEYNLKYKNGEIIPTETEADIFKALKMECVAPEDRD